MDDKGLPAGAELGASDVAHDRDGGLAEAGGHDLSGAGEEPVLVPDFDNVRSFAHGVVYSSPRKSAPRGKRSG